MMGNTISVALAEDEDRPQYAVHHTITLVYTLVRGMRADPLWDKGNVIPATLVSCDELYSPSLDEVISPCGFIMPIPHDQPKNLAKLKPDCAIKFLTAIRGLGSNLPTINVIRNIEIVLGGERSQFMDMYGDCDTYTHPFTLLRWQRPFVFANHVAAHWEQQKRHQEQRRQREAKSKEQRALARFVDDNNNLCLLDNALIPPPSGSDKFMAKPKLVQ